MAIGLRSSDRRDYFGASDATIFSKRGSPRIGTFLPGCLERGNYLPDVLQVSRMPAPAYRLHNYYFRFGLYYFRFGLSKVTINQSPQLNR